MFDISKMLRKAVCLVCIAGMCFSFTGCFTILRAVAEVNAEDKVKDFLDAFFEDPGAVDFDDYIDDNVRFSLDSNQESFFYLATEGITYSITDTDLKSSRKKCDITVTFKHAYDISDIDIEDAPYEEYEMELDSLSYDKVEIEFSLERDRYEQWIITDYSDFEDFFMDPFEDLNITDSPVTDPSADPSDPTTVTPAPSQGAGSMDATTYEEIQASYIYTVWYDVELDQPMEQDQVSPEKAYAIKNVFYFNRPVTATLHAELFDQQDTLILSKDIELNGNVICPCDFSAGLEGMVQFESGDYYIVISMNGNQIAKSDILTVG